MIPKSKFFLALAQVETIETLLLFLEKVVERFNHYTLSTQSVDLSDHFGITPHNYIFHFNTTTISCGIRNQLNPIILTQPAGFYWKKMFHRWNINKNSWWRIRSDNHNILRLSHFVRDSSIIEIVWASYHSKFDENQISVVQKKSWIPPVAVEFWPSGMIKFR